MRRIANVAAGIAVLALVPAWRLAAQSTAAATPWVHVRVDEARKGSKVAVNLPLSVVQAALQAAPERVVSQGRIQLGPHQRLSVADLRRLWTELKSAGDAELVSVEEQDQSVHVARRGDLVEVRVEHPGGKPQVHVQVPVTVVDALLSGPGDELDLKAALAQLQGRGGEIVRVDAEDAQVRVWIDGGN